MALLVCGFSMFLFQSIPILFLAFACMHGWVSHILLRAYITFVDEGGRGDGWMNGCREEELFLENVDKKSAE